MDKELNKDKIQRIAQAIATLHLAISEKLSELAEEIYDQDEKAKE